VALWGNLLSVYEKQLYPACAGFIGWTLYLTGAALRLGARRAVTVEGTIDPEVFVSRTPEARLRYGLGLRHLVCGLVGSLRWTLRQHYGYGWELVQTLKRVQRPDVFQLIVGDGDGRPRLEATLPEELRALAVFTGRLPETAECRYCVHQFPLAPRLLRFKAYALAARTARTDFSGFDVLHAHGDNYLLDGRHPQVRTFYGSARDEARFAVSLRRHLYQWLMIGLENRGARVADLNVGISEATRARLPRIQTIIPCGVDGERFRPCARADKASAPTMLFVGTVGGRKRGAFLADLFSRTVRPRFPNAQLWSVADAPLAGEGIVNFGKVTLETLADLYARAWVFCLPSTYEGFGVPYVEALAAGTAVVASPNPGAREVLCEGKFGVLASDETLGEALCDLLGDAGRRDALAAGGLARARDFSWEQVAARYEQVYADLLGRTRHDQEKAA